MEEFLPRRADSEKAGGNIPVHHLNRRTVAKKNDTSAQTYGEPQTRAERR